ncbi:MAG TPA: sigma-54 dependent transcriptional regulator [Acidobacteriota bacterium]|nr:sigma-54 dependent transcriptional regulator [Acidobacteriota bacterium]
MRISILIVDDEPNITLSFSSLLKDEGYSPVTAASAEQAAEKCARQSFELILLDLQLPGQSGLDFLRQLKADPLAPPVLVISGQADIPMALEAVRLGAVDFLEKPVLPEKLIASAKTALLLAAADRQRTVLVDEMDERCRIVGQSAAIKKTLATISRVAPVDTTVLVTGENGTGKELVATRLYLQSHRRDRPFIRVNCPGIPETLFESELFGHVKGAFTGAIKDYPGKFVMADGGTIFLDEIGDLPLPCQAKLLRVLETGEIETLGADSHRLVDTRIICATNQDLEQLVREGRFRQDLYFRVSVFVLRVPSLAERREDIPLLVGEFLRRFDPSQSVKLSAEALACIGTLLYPGNVRQLKNLIERLTILYRGRTVQPEDIDAEFRGPAGAACPGPTELSLGERLALLERQIIEKTLGQTGGNISETARRLKIDRSNLSRKVKDFRLKIP